MTAHTGGGQFDIDLGSQLRIDGEPRALELESRGDGIYCVRSGERSFIICVERIDERTYDIWIKRFVVRVVLETERSQLAARFQTAAQHSTGTMTIKAPMPGLVHSIPVKPGDTVTEGSSLVILEAMKMENEIRASAAGRVISILVEPKGAVEKSQPLMIISLE